MRYRGRHRQVAQGQKRLRRTGTVAVVVVSALIAPLAFSVPVASQATVSTPTLDTLANHPEWLRSSSDPEVATLIANLKEVYTENHVAYDAAKIAAYRVPTVEGFVTYVTTRPATFRVTPNPDRLYTFPYSGDPRELVTRWGNAVPTPDGSHATVVVPAGGGVPSVSLNFDDLSAVLDELGDSAQQVIDLFTDPTFVEQVKQFIEDNSIEYQGDDPVESAVSLATQVYNYAADPATLEGIKQFIRDNGIKIQGTDPVSEAFAVVDLATTLVRLVQGYISDPPVTPPSVDDLMLVIAYVTDAVDALRQELDALTIEADPEGEAAEVFNVVPLANASLPVNTGTAVTSPLSQPISQPVDGAMGVLPVPQVQSVYGEADEDNPEWNRNNDDCFLSDNNAWYRQTCWTIDNQINDDSADSTYWQFQMKAASYAKQKRGMYHVWTEGVPITDYSAQQFDGTLPVPDQEVGGESGCASGTQSLSLSGGKPIQVGYSYSYSITTCESYTPKGYSDEGHWSNKWHFNPDRNSNGVGYGSSDAHMRSVGFNMGIKTSSSATKVGWTMPTGTEVSKKYCC